MGMWLPGVIDGQIARQIAACGECKSDLRPCMFVCDYHEGWIAALDGMDGHAMIDGEMYAVQGVAYVHDSLCKAWLVPFAASEQEADH